MKSVYDSFSILHRWNLTIIHILFRKIDRVQLHFGIRTTETSLQTSFEVRTVTHGSAIWAILV
jgi:hypothetical protein